MGNCFSAPEQQEALPTGRGKALKITDHVLQAEDDVRKYYTFDKVLGKGNFGVVHQVRFRVFLISHTLISLTVVNDMFLDTDFREILETAILFREDYKVS